MDNLARSAPLHPAEATDLRAQFERQRVAFNTSDAPDYEARRQSLQKLKRLVRENAEAFANAISADFRNRAYQETMLLEVAPSLSGIQHALSNLKRWMRPERRKVSLNFWPGRAWIQYQPLGVVGIISPWNYPLYLAAGPLADALAAGNRAMLKPSELTPAFSALFQQLIAKSFAPEQVTVITGGPEIAQEFSALPFDHLLFTGSTAVGKKVMQAAANNLTPVTLELGGKSPAIVADDYQIEKAARSIAQGKWVNAGQTCIAPDYVLAPADKAAALAEALLGETRSMFPAVATNPDYTAIVNERHVQRLKEMIAEAERLGATVMRHADDAVASPAKLAPALIIDPLPDSAVMTEEIFGPVLPIVSYRSLDEAIAFVNARARPLALYVFSTKRETQERVLSQTISGGVTVNGTLLHIGQDDLPFGGVGPSGMGAYHGHEGFKRFSHAKAVFKSGFFNGFELLRPPYGKLAANAIRYLTGVRKQT